MVKCQELITPPRGYIQLEIRDIETKKVEKVIKTNNIVVYGGSEILARALSGDNSYRITNIYAEHAAHPGTYTEGSTNGLVALKSDTIDTMRVSPRETSNAESPLIFSNFRTSATPYKNNVVTFSASWNSSSLDGRIIGGAGLVVQLKNIEILYAHAYFLAEVKQPGKELICHWSQLFT